MPRERPLSVLVVDDDELVGSTTEEMLREAGFAARFVNGAAAAFAVLDQDATIDLLITDVMMPGIDGITLADITQKKYPRLKVIYTTGFTDVALSVPRLIHGNALRKPYRFNDLCLAVQRATDCEP